MHIGEGQTSIASPLGTLFSILLYTLVIVYAAQKLVRMTSGTYDQITKTELTNFFDDSVNISAEDGFNFAVALVYKSDISLIMDSSYFSFELQVQNWYVDDQGERYQETIPA